MIKNLIFDWSGTLSDDLVSVYTIVRNIFRRLGLRELTFSECRIEFMLPYMDFWKKFTDKSREEIQQMFIEEYDKVWKSKPFTGAKATLEFLHKNNKMLAILSSQPQKQLEKEVNDYGFKDLFCDIRGSIHNKIENINSLIGRNKFVLDETVMIGDMMHDIEAGKKAKIKTVAVLWGYDSKDKLESKKPDFIVRNFVELKKIFS